MSNASSPSLCRRSLTINVPKAFADSLYSAAGPSGDVDRVISLCLGMHLAYEAANGRRMMPTFSERMMRAQLSFGPREWMAVWLPLDQADAVLAHAAALNTTPAQVIAGMVGAAAHTLAERGPTPGFAGRAHAS